MCNIDICPKCYYILPFEEGRDFNSPLAKYLGTNHIPTDTERRIAEEVIAEISLSIKILEEQMSRLRKSTKMLELYKREHEVLLSRFQDFPPEILGLIFQMYVDSCVARKEIVTTDDLDFKPGDVRGMPRSNSRMDILLTITGVCRQWRAIALSTSSLWNNIHLSLGFRQLEKWENMVPLFIRRAGQRPLSIDVDLDDWGNAENGRAILHTLGSRSEQWKDAAFMLSFTTISHFKAAVTKLDGHLPELEFLSLGMSGSDSSPSLRIEVAPKLRALQLINLRPERMILPWHQLQELSLVHIHWRHTLNLMEMCPHLKSLQCEVLDGKLDSMHVDRDTLVRHQRLSSLRLITSPKNFAFINTLELPALSSLALVTQSAQDYGDHLQLYQFPILLRFLSRSRCTLQSLSLENINICPKDWAEYTSLFSGLTTLKLTESSDVPYGDVLKSLVVVEPDGHPWTMEDTRPALPLLRHLEYTYNNVASLWGPSYYDAIFQSINKVIASRSNMSFEGSSDVHVHRLLSVKVLGPRPDVDPERVFAYRQLLGFHCKELSVEIYFSTSPETRKVCSFASFSAKDMI